MNITHITADFPDRLGPSKTWAISNLIDLTRNRFEHRIYSLNRASPGLTELVGALLRGPIAPEFGIEAFPDASDVQAIRYAGPPKGLYLRGVLDRLADWIADDITRRAYRPALVQGHKLTIEGLVAAKVAERLGVPYALTLQGNTDQKILLFRPDLARLYRRIFHGAEVAFAFSAWGLRFAEQRFGIRSRASICLPIPTPQDAIVPPILAGPALVSAFHLDHFRLKNAEALIRASRTLARELAGYELAIIGGGSARSVTSLEAMIARSGTNNIRLEGAIPHERIQRRFNMAGGFALVSKRETFGMVFIEALLAGCPIVYPEGRAVAGYFDDFPFAIAAPPGDLEAITDAVRRLVKDEPILKRSLAEWQQSGAAQRFQRAAIAQCYTDELERAIARSGSSETA